MLAVDPGEIRLDGAHGDVQLGGDLLVRPPARREIDDLLLGLGETLGARTGPADACQLGVRALRPDRRAELLEDQRGLVEGVPRGSLLPRAPERDPVDEERAAPLEPLLQLVVPCERGFEVGERALGIAGRSGQQAMAAQRRRGRR